MINVLEGSRCNKMWGLIRKGSFVTVYTRKHVIPLKPKPRTDCHSSEVLESKYKEVKTWGDWRSWLHITPKKTRTKSRDECLPLLSSHSPFIQSSIPLRKWSHPQWVNLPTPINVIKISPHGHVQRLIYQVILDSIKLRIDTNHNNRLESKKVKHHLLNH